MCLFDFEGEGEHCRFALSCLSPNLALYRVLYRLIRTRKSAETQDNKRRMNIDKTQEVIERER